MKTLKIVTPVVLLILIALLIAAPIGPLPGMFIGGSAADVPDKWQDTIGIDEIKLEVQGTLPRVVIIWVVQVDGDLHVVGSKGSGWVEMLGDGGTVRMRINDKTYSLKASLLNTGWEPILQAYTDKYRADYPDMVKSFPPVDEAKATTAVFRLTAL